jgi:hypothetical protein
MIVLEIIGSVVMAILAIYFVKVVGLYEAADAGIFRTLLIGSVMFYFIKSFRAGLRGLPFRGKSKKVDSDSDPMAQDEEYCPNCASPLKSPRLA